MLSLIWIFMSLVEVGEVRYTKKHGRTHCPDQEMHCHDYLCVQRSLKCQTTLKNRSVKFFLLGYWDCLNEYWDCLKAVYSTCMAISFHISRDISGISVGWKFRHSWILDSQALPVPPKGLDTPHTIWCPVQRICLQTNDCKDLFEVVSQSWLQSPN